MKRLTPQKTPTKLTQAQRDAIDAAVLVLISTSPHPLTKKHIESNRLTWETLNDFPLCRDDRASSDHRHLDAALQRLHKAGKILFYRKAWSVTSE